MRILHKNSITVLRTVMLSAALLIANFANAEVPFEGGDGTAGTPYLIKTPAQLAAISTGLGKHYKLVNDITLTEAWTPIGANPFFTGTLDGDGHKISGLYTEDTKGGALIATSDGGTVKNLGVEITGEGIKAQAYGGGIVGQNTGTISNCYVTGASIYVENNDADRESCAGGITGRNINGGKVLNCYSSVQTITVNRKSGSKEMYVGGIAGQNTGGTITGCLAINGELIFQKNGQPAYAGYNGAIGNDGSCTNNFAWYKTKRGVTTYDRSYSGTPWGGTAPNGEAWSISGENLVLYKGGTTNGMITIPISLYKYLKGLGTQSDPYLITNDADLRKLSDYTNNGKNSCAGTYYKLANNIEMSNVPFTPINNKTFKIGNSHFRRPFSGTFDGDGKIISNLYINSPEAYNGLFGTVEGCTIKNMGLKACDINVTFEGDGVVSIGAIVGADHTISQAITKPSVIENCFVTGSIKMLGKVGDGSWGSNGCSIGGIVGTSSLIKVLNSYTDLSIIDQGNGTATYNSIGGIVGRVEAEDEGDLVNNCYVLGNITTTQQIGVGIGGIVGFSCRNKKVSNNLVLCNKIEKTNQTSDSWRVVTGSGKESNITNNYVFEQMLLIKQGTVQVVTPGSAFHGTNWDKKTAPSSDWTIENGYLNLNSIKTTFENSQQIKLSNYDPFAITVDENLKNGNITANPSEAYIGNTVKLTITPKQGYALKPNSLKAQGAVTDTVKVDMSDSTFVMPAQAVTLTAEFAPDTLRLADIAVGDTLHILHENAGWFYELKNKVVRSRQLDTKIPFNGVIAGTLPSGKVLSFEPSCKDELTMKNVTVSTLIIKEGASVILSNTSQLTYTNVENKGGNLIARKGAIINTSSGQLKLSKLTITTPQNGTVAVGVGNLSISSGDMLALGTKFSVTATPASGYQTESLSVKTASGDDVTLQNSLYTMPDAEVTVLATFKSTYVPPVPDPDPVYYTVTMPKVEGAVTDPQAGAYASEEGTSFTFTLKLEAGYEQSVPVVTANGTVLTPRVSDGKYVIRNIGEDTQIKIDGIVRDNPTGNAEIESDGIRISSTVGTLLISTPLPAALEIYTYSGRRVHYSNLSAGDSRIALSAGIYIVRVGERSEKVIVR